MKFIEKTFDSLRNEHAKFYKGFLTVVAVVIIIWLYPTQVSFKYEFYQGSPWQNEDLLAPFDFAILKTDNELKTEKDEVVKTLVPIYKKDYEREIKSVELFESIWEQDGYEVLKDTADVFAGDSIRLLIAEQIQKIYNKGIISIDNDKGKPANDEYILLTDNEDGKDRLITDFYNLKGALVELEKHFTDTTLVYQEGLLNIVSTTLDYNIVFDQIKTELLVNDELKNISPYRGKIEKGTIIIQRGEIVTPAKNQELTSLKQQYENKLGANIDVWWLIFGEIITLLVILWITYQYIFLFNNDIIIHPTGWSFILIFFVLAVVMFKVGVYDAHLNQFLMPILIFPIIIRAFFDVRLALYIHLTIVFLVSGLVPNPYEFITIQVLAGFIVLYSLKTLRKRAHFFLTALIIFLSYSLVQFSLSIYQIGSIGRIDWMAYRWFLGNGLLTLFAYPLIYLFEKLFGYLSDLTLIEMIDMNNRILRKLAEKAPGTFQHSMQVANLAEAAIREIGGKELLVRVRAMYHDIGKTFNPQYFIENQVHGYNPHDELSNEESAEIIINHVIDGIEMARKSKLPDVIIDFIRTHHGITRVEYFYRLFLQENPDQEVDESLFTYPGPKPYSKETAVLMMADGVEAASRSLKKYDRESIESLVNTMIDNNIKSGQFENADINFKDIKRIKKIFIKMLLNIYHVRIEYPK
jgi:putative nucleotidyltransferase with HDIG domain